MTLPDGKVWCCSGYDEYGIINRIVEVYDPSSKTWTLVEDPNSNYTYTVGAGYEATFPGPHPSYSRVCPPVSFYPRTHLLLNGLLYLAGTLPTATSFPGVIILSIEIMERHFYARYKIQPLRKVKSY